MPRLQDFDRDEDDGWTSSSSASPAPMYAELNDRDDTTMHTDQESKPITLPAVKFESLSPSPSPCPGSSSNLLYDVPAERAEEWSDDTTEDEEENNLLRKFTQGSGLVDLDYKSNHVRANSGLRRSVQHPNSGSGGLGETLSTLVSPKARSVRPSFNSAHRRRNHSAKRYIPPPKYPRDPTTELGKHRILSADTMAVTRLYQRLEASKGWKSLDEDEREALKEYEKGKLMRDRFDNGQSWEYWTSGLAPVQSQIDDQMPVDPPEALRSDRAFRKKEPARHVEPDGLDESLPPTMGDSDALEPEVFETDEENETATEANASQSRRNVVRTGDEKRSDPGS